MCCDRWCLGTGGLRGEGLDSGGAYRRRRDLPGPQLELMAELGRGRGLEKNRKEQRRRGLPQAEERGWRLGSA